MLWRPRFTFSQWLCIALLFVLFVVLNSQSFWQIMYPIAYENEVHEASSHFDVDPFLMLAIMKNESRFQQDITSKKGARGLMQLMPETAQWVNKESGLNKEMDQYIEDPRVNILFGAWYLSYLSHKYDGDQVKVIVAYNAGEGNVDRWIEQGIWDGDQLTTQHIPFGETRHYVKRVNYFYERYKEIYGAEFNNQ